MSTETSRAEAGDQPTAGKLDLISQMTGMSEEELLDALRQEYDGDDPAVESGLPAAGYFAVIAFMGHNEHTGYVTETVKNGQPAYHVDLPEKLWGGNPLSWVEYAASAWFSERPVTEEFVRTAWERHLRQVAERKRREAEWARAGEQRAIADGGDDEAPEGYDEDDRLY